MVGIVRLYPRIPLEKSLKHLDKQGKKSIPTGDLGQDGRVCVKE